MATTLGEKIRTLRKEKGYTLEKLAELTDSSKSYIWELENKSPPRPSAGGASAFLQRGDCEYSLVVDRDPKTQPHRQVDYGKDQRAHTPRPRVVPGPRRADRPRNPRIPRNPRKSTRERRR